MNIVFGLIAAFVMYHVYTTTGGIWYTILSGIGVFIAAEISKFLFWLLREMARI
nr:hypothetical protein [Brucella intermedia]